MLVKYTLAHLNDHYTSRTDLFRYFFRLAWVGFGGPLAHISMMEHDVVEKKKWMSQEEFTGILGMTNMLPGPNSTELAIHIGHAMGGRIGGIISGIAFTLPGFFIMLALSYLYFELGGIPSVSGIFYGVNPVVIVIIAITAIRLGRGSAKDYKSIGIAAAVFAAILLTEVNEAIVLLAAGAVGLLLYPPRKSGSGSNPSSSLPPSGFRPPPSNMTPVFIALPIFALVYSLSAIPVELQLFLEFLKAGALLFGSGLVIVPLIGADVVESFGWMSYSQFFDGVTLGQVTPGPVVKTAAFVGYSVGGVLGAGIATLGVFLPPFAIVTILAPVFKKVKSNAWLQSFLKGVRPGAVGAILAVAVTLGQTALIDVWTIVIAAAALIALTKFKLSIPLTVVVAAVVGVAITCLRAVS